MLGPDRSAERSQKQSSEPVRSTAETPLAAPAAPLVISVEAAERLRQMLRTEKLTSESELVELVKDRLATQYARGLADSMGNHLDELVTGYEKLDRDFKDNVELAQMAEAEKDDAMLAEAEEGGGVDPVLRSSGGSASRSRKRCAHTAPAPRWW